MPDADNHRVYALVVDDDPLILMHACDILEAAGLRFHEAGTGAEAKTLLASHAEEVTLLFSDVEMPDEINGFAVARYVDEHWRWIEIVIASGNLKPEPETCPRRRPLSASRSTTAWFWSISRRCCPTTSSPSR